jgi:hypothetical protein
VTAAQMIGRLAESDLPEPSAESQWIAQCIQLAPRLQKDLLCKIVYVARRHVRQEHGMHHAEELAVQFAESGIVAGARCADHMPQFD